MMMGASSRPLPIMSGQRVLRLAGGSPCLQSASNRLLLIVRPELLLFAAELSCFLLSFQQEQMASSPLAMYPFSLGFLSL